MSTVLLLCGMFTVVFGVSAAATYWLSVLIGNRYQRKSLAR